MDQIYLVTTRVFLTVEGGGDTLSKSCSMEEFLARAHSAFRRWLEYKAGRLAQGNLNLIGSILIDEDTRQVFVNEEYIRLTPTEFDIVLYRAQRAGRVVAYRELLRAVRGEKNDEELEYFRVFNSQIRKN